MPVTSSVPGHVAAAVGRVLDIDPTVLRADTPLADLGADPVALVAIVDLMLGPDGIGIGAASPESLDIPSPTTVGDLAQLVR